MFELPRGSKDSPYSGKPGSVWPRKSVRVVGTRGMTVPVNLGARMFVDCGTVASQLLHSLQPVLQVRAPSSCGCAKSLSASAPPSGSSRLLKAGVWHPILHNIARGAVSL